MAVSDREMKMIGQHLKDVSIYQMTTNKFTTVISNALHHTLRVHIFARIYFRESKKFAFREDLFSRIEVFQKFREDLFSRIQSFTNFREDLFSRNRPYKVLKKMIDCVNYGD